jgi:2-oxoglutarate ferredoxin oxidoreductase subunit beta
MPEVVELGKGIKEDDLIFHDEKAPQPTLAYLLSRMHHPELPEPIGVFRAVDKPIFDVELNAQVKQVRDKKGEGDINALINSGDTWTVA